MNNDMIFNVGDLVVCKDSFLSYEKSDIALVISCAVIQGIVEIVLLNKSGMKTCTTWHLETFTKSANRASLFIKNYDTQRTLRGI